MLDCNRKEAYKGPAQGPATWVWLPSRSPYSPNRPLSSPLAMSTIGQAWYVTARLTAGRAERAQAEFETTCFLHETSPVVPPFATWSVHMSQSRRN